MANDDQCLFLHRPVKIVRYAKILMSILFYPFIFKVVMANDTTISPTTETKGDNKRSLLICIQLLYFHFHNVTCIFSS